jgi:hypothetical protein
MIGFVLKEVYFFYLFFNNYYGEFVISKRLSGHYKFEFQKGKTILRVMLMSCMDCESAAEELRLF